MKKTCILFAAITIFILAVYVVFPKNLGEHTPIWDIKERFFGDEYGEVRSEYFISMRMTRLWYEQQDILFIWNDHDIFRMTEVYLRVRKEIADNCKINTSGIIEWQRYDLHVLIMANALTDEPLIVQKGFDKYNLDRTEDSINEFEAATGIKADELLDTVALLRSEYKEALREISEKEYQNVCEKVKKRIRGLIIMWGVYVLIWGIVRTTEKKYQKAIDESMKDFL